MADHGRIVNGCPAWREPKNPAGVEQYSLDLIDWLDNESLTGVSWSTDGSTGINIDAQSYAGSIAYVLISSGSLGYKKLTLTASTAVRTKVMNVIVEIKEC